MRPNTVHRVQERLICLIQGPQTGRCPYHGSFLFQRPKCLTDFPKTCRFWDMVKTEGKKVEDRHLAGLPTDSAIIPWRRARVFYIVERCPVDLVCLSESV